MNKLQLVAAIAKDRRAVTRLQTLLIYDEMIKFLGSGDNPVLPVDIVKAVAPCPQCAEREQRDAEFLAKDAKRKRRDRAREKKAKDHGRPKAGARKRERREPSADGAALHPAGAGGE